MKVWHVASLYRIGLQLGRVWLWSGLLITDIKRMITAAPGNELDKTVHINISCCKKKGKCINFYLPISICEISITEALDILQSCSELSSGFFVEDARFDIITVLNFPENDKWISNLC